jgi:hypothetical protein
MKPLCNQIFDDEVALGRHRELSDALCQLLCVDRPLYCPPPTHLEEPREEMLRILLRYSVKARAYSVRRMLKARLSMYH